MCIYFASPKHPAHAEDDRRLAGAGEAGLAVGLFHRFEMAKRFFDGGGALAARGVMVFEPGGLFGAKGPVAVGFRDLIDVVGAGGRRWRH